MNHLGLLESDLGYEFKNSNLLTQALSHRSIGAPNNERLEYLGDSILGFVIAEHLYKKFSKVAEGDLTKMRARLVRQKTLAELARGLKLQSHLILGSGELKSGGYDRDSILSDALEAIIGAVYLDGGLTQVRVVLDPLYKDLLETIQPIDLKDHKTLLQEELQKRNLPLPSYSVINQVGEAHKLTFTVLCEVSEPENRLTAEGNSRKTAEQLVAEKVLGALMLGWANNDS